MRKHASFRSRVLAILLIFFAMVFVVPALRAGNAVFWMLSAAVPFAILILLLFPARVFFLDKPSLTAALVVCGFGIMAYSGISPEAALSQSLRCISAVFFVFAGAVLVRSFRPSLPAAALTAAIALGMLSFPSFSVGSLSLKEGGLALLMFSLAAFLSHRFCLPGLVIALGGLLILLLQQETVSAAVWSLCAVILFWTASGRGLWSGIALGSCCALYAVFMEFSLHPSETAIEPLLPRLSALPLIAPETEWTVEASPDSLFLLLGERYGSIILACIPFLLSLILLRGASLALHARKGFHAALAFGVVLLLGLRTLSAMAAFPGLLSSPAESFPFLTDSVPQLAADCFLLGILSGVSFLNEEDLSEDARLSMLAR